MTTDQRPRDKNRSKVYDIEGVWERRYSEARRQVSVQVLADATSTAWLHLGLGARLAPPAVVFSSRMKYPEYTIRKNTVVLTRDYCDVGTWCHELAHAAVEADKLLCPFHGALWRGYYIDLVVRYLGDRAGLELQHLFGKHGLWCV